MQLAACICEAMKTSDTEKTTLVHEHLLSLAKGVEYRQSLHINLIIEELHWIATREPYIIDVVGIS